MSTSPTLAKNTPSPPPPRHIVIDARMRRSSTGRYVDRLIEHLQAIDAVNTYTILLEPDDDWRAKASNFTVLPCRYRQFSFNPLEQIGFTYQLKKLRPDLVHFTMTQQPLLYFGKIVTTTHDLTMLEFARAGQLPQVIHSLRMFLYRFLLWWSHRKSDSIIVPTNYVKGDVARRYPFTRDRVVVTYEASEPPQPIKATQPQNSQEPYILFVGRAFPHKNLEALIRAFEQLWADQSDLHLILAGKKEYYYLLLEEFASRSPARQSILFTDFVSEAELKWLYQHALAYVLPSLSEGFSLSGLEAMTYQCPVVSSNATCLPEVYGDGAYYFDPQNIEDMAAKIQDVVSSPRLRQQLIVAGNAQVQKYSWKKMAQQTWLVYQSVLNAK